MTKTFNNILKIHYSTKKQVQCGIVQTLIWVGSFLSIRSVSSIQTAGRVCQISPYPAGPADWKTRRRNRKQPV